MADQQQSPTPEAWLARLYKQLIERHQMCDFFDAYYTGNHPLPWLAPQAQDDFRRILQMTRSNYMGLVVDAMVERMQIEGFRIGETEEADRETWRIWQANNMDSDSDQGLLEAAICGVSYIGVDVNPRDPGTPVLTVEHPKQAIVAYHPGSGRRVRAAGLKVWVDDWTGEVNATLQALGAVFKFKASKPNGNAGSVQWERRLVAGERWGDRNPLGDVGLVELPNNPRLLTGGVSEIFDLTDIQDRINKTLADRLMTQDYGAFPQKWAKGWPEEDAAGNPTPPIAIGRNRMVTTDVSEAAFGQWDAAPLDPYSSAKREDVKDLASRSRTPAQYLLGEMSNVNGETLKASESGLISKVRQRARTFGEPIEEAIRLARRVAGLSSGDDGEIETLWRDPQYRTEGEQTDAAIKRFQAGITSLRQTREDLGYSQTQIGNMELQDSQAASDPTTERLIQAMNNPPAAAIGASAAVGG